MRRATPGILITCHGIREPFCCSIAGPQWLAPFSTCVTHYRRPVMGLAQVLGARWEAPLLSPSCRNLLRSVRAAHVQLGCADAAKQSNCMVVTESSCAIQPHDCTASQLRQGVCWLGRCHPGSKSPYQYPQPRDADLAEHHRALPQMLCGRVFRCGGDAPPQLSRGRCHRDSKPAGAADAREGPTRAGSPAARPTARCEPLCTVPAMPTPLVLSCAVC